MRWGRGDMLGWGEIVYRKASFKKAVFVNIVVLKKRGVLDFDCSENQPSKVKTQIH